MIAWVTGFVKYKPCPYCELLKKLKGKENRYVPSVMAGTKLCFKHTLYSKVEKLHHKILKLLEK